MWYTSFGSLTLAHGRKCNSINSKRWMPRITEMKIIWIHMTYQDEFDIAVS
jgi:hypothetical protein